VPEAWPDVGWLRFTSPPVFSGKISPKEKKKKRK